MSRRWRTIRAYATSWACALGACAALTACGGPDESVVKTADGIRLSDQQLDGDPLALLPSGYLALMHIDAQKLFQSAFGKKILNMVQRRSPLPASANFQPSRDLSALYLGVYSFSGADVAAVARGNFDPAAIEAAADGTTNTPLGAPVVKRTYAGRTLYVSRNIGFTVLTRQTVLFGNETGIRRALDRLEEGFYTANTPKWLNELMQNPNAAIAMGADVREHPELSALEDKYPVFRGLQRARVLGNFEPPGMNFAGTLTYDDEQSATTGASEVLRLHQTIKNITWFTQWFGYGDPIKNLQVQANGKSAQFVAGLDGQAVSQLIEQLGNMLNGM